MPGSRATAFSGRAAARHSVRRMVRQVVHLRIISQIASGAPTIAAMPKMKGYSPMPSAMLAIDPGLRAEIKPQATKAQPTPWTTSRTPRTRFRPRIWCMMMATSVQTKKAAKLPPRNAGIRSIGQRSPPIPEDSAHPKSAAWHAAHKTTMVGPKSSRYFRSQKG